jgi:hypothetical protein
MRGDVKCLPLCNVVERFITSGARVVSEDAVYGVISAFTYWAELGNPYVTIEWYNGKSGTKKLKEWTGVWLTPEAVLRAREAVRRQGEAYARSAGRVA